MEKKNPPTEIIQLIGLADDELKERAEQLAQKEYLAQEKARLARQRDTEAFCVNVLSIMPDVIRPYLFITDVDIHDEKYCLHWSERALEFHVPGLAPFLAVFSIEKDLPNGVSFDGWKIPTVVETDWDEGTDMCLEASYSFRNQSVFEDEIKYVLRAALQVAFEREETQNRLNSKHASHIFNNSRRKAEEAAIEKSRLAEETALLNSIKDDPIAIHLLKAFVLLREERGAFERRIEEMDDQMYGMEDRWSRKAADLRRQADDVERRARDEQSRLQNDLDDAEAKLRKAQRG